MPFHVLGRERVDIRHAWVLRVDRSRDDQIGIVHSAPFAFFGSHPSQVAV